MSNSPFNTQEVTLGSDYILVHHKQVLSYLAATSKVAKKKKFACPFGNATPKSKLFF
jgi:hypothetical protein